MPRGDLPGILDCFGLPGVLLYLVVLGNTGCKSPAGNNAETDANFIDTGAVGGGDARRDANRPDGLSSTPPSDAPAACFTEAGAGTKGKSETCTCDSECRTGFCVDGVCCASACTETCKACNLPTSLGDCAFIPAGVKPGDTHACSTTTPSTCGQDGTCDGEGGCRKYVVGTECKTGTCDVDTVAGALTCDGKGACSQSATTPCFPYSCDPATNECANSCVTNKQCATGQSCLAQSCGKKLNGFLCTNDDDCVAGHCANGVCCNIACTGACVSCNQTGSVGRCKFIDAGLPHPACTANLPSTCGTTGSCDGAGACALYPENTPCGSASCTGAVFSDSARTCDGQGTCQGAQLLDCSPYLCTNGACNGSCRTDADCELGHTCVATVVRGLSTGMCGKKKNGQPCADATECDSTQCVDGVCCENSCAGPCRSCGLPGSPGQCVNVASGAPDPRDTCTDKGKESCQTSGVCDGSGACQKYPSGSTVCAAESCQLGAFTPAAACNAAGQCVAPPSVTCNPYICNGTSCFKTCTTDKQCVPGNFCLSGSCGLKQPGAECSAGPECQSGSCAQGVCCNTSCAEACVACNLSASLGRCTAVADGSPDPQGVCAVTAQTTCGTTGACNSGACAYFAKGLNCKQAVCATGSSTTPASTCDGIGSCVTPENRSCGTFVCSSAACENTCATDKDCVSPNTCVNSSCGLKPNGGACSAGNQCASTFCTEGICCDTACSDATTGALCMSCKVSGKVGTCSPVPTGGSDPKSHCAASSAAAGDCSNDGTCNGAGACRPWSTSTGCRPASCGGSTFTPAVNCDGKGGCSAATTQACDPYKCSITSPSCLTTCTADTDCTGGLTCLKTNNQCGTKLPAGQSCKANTDCNSGHCTAEGVCCNSDCTGACQSCVLSGKVGTCGNIASGGSPRDNTTCAAGSNACGNTSKCDGNGGCQLASTGKVCGTASCAASVSGTLSGGTVSESLAKVPAPTCNGAGACISAAAISCGTFQCDATTGTCKTSCSSTSVDCNALAPSTTDPSGGNSCVSGTCQKKPNGSVCSNGFACVSGNCVDGVCCGSPQCGTCFACNVANASGTLDGNCRAVGVGAAEPHNLCTVTANTSCGTDGKCNGAGGCESWNGTACTPVRTSCADAHHAISTSGTCSGAGACTAGTPVACNTGFLCSAGACATACTTANASTTCDTANGFSCIGGLCQKEGQGSTCASAGQCSTGNCVDGVCCVSSSCAVCSSCNVGGFVGTCHPVGAGIADGTCVATCPTSGQMSGLCDGTGACRGSTACLPGYLCAGGSCATTCTTNGACDVANGYACFNGSCKKNPGQACSANADCGLGFCTQGLCCNSACTGSCQTCIATPGTCTSIAPGGSPRDPGFCPASPPCGDTGACNGSGGCQVASAVTACTVALSCAAGVQSGGSSSCDGVGHCNTPTPATCQSGYACVGNACATSCSGANTGCASGYSCAAGTCKKASGQVCSADADCAAGHCVGDGIGTTKVCCITGCTDAACGTKALCMADGSACQTHGDESCGAAVCATDNRASIGAGICNGSGTCVPPTAVACTTGYLCAAGACAKSCLSDSSCDVANGYACSGSACKKKDGQACSAGGDCAAGSFCISDGSAKVCCADACADVACGTKALCLSDGSACQSHGGESCGAATCSVDQRSSIAAGVCDGSGTCTPPASVPCATGYLCAAGVCPATCNSNSACDGANGYACSGVHCKKTSGQTCSSASDCATGDCLSDGTGNRKICCATSCSDVACASKALCLSDGSACQSHAGESCGSAGCTDDNLSSVPAGTCDGSGGCNQAPTSCLGYLCANGACALSCVDDGSCDTGDGFHCDTTATTPGTCHL